jgi:DNA-binding HxlR family transcriptional regulator
MTSKARPRRSPCPINATLEMVGDHWSLLIVRDLMFRGRTTFKEFLAGGEGIATNILTDRLQRLEACGLISRRPHPADARKTIYQLTEKGIDLAPLLVEMVLYGARHAKTDAPPAILRAMREDREGFLANIRRQWQAASTPPRRSGN